MTGENPDRSAQPGGREQAPGELALVQAFVNSHYDIRVKGGGELLATPAMLRDWLAAHGLIGPRERLRRRDVDRAVAVREGMRALAYANNDEALDPAAIDAMRRASLGARTEIRLEPDAPRFVAVGGGIDGALGALLAITARSMIDGSWRRLKACPGRDCGWAFYDRSRNQSSHWCSMKVCGDREKARAYYRRKTRGGAGD
jgi:putative stress-induced transcription regulator/CGNR zinc finger protein